MTGATPGAGVALALFQPQIPANTGSLIRLCACLDTPLHLVEPLGFVWTDRHFSRAAMDYRMQCRITLHPDWKRFQNSWSGRSILVTPEGKTPFQDFVFGPGDALVMGREADGFPQDIRQQGHWSVRIPMKSGCRSINMAMAATLVLGEALRQTASVPSL
jgi:tRNA (cytidine/uridine-2'-O-)-methyltransferase